MLYCAGCEGDEYKTGVMISMPYAAVDEWETALCVPCYEKQYDRKVLLDEDGEVIANQVLHPWHYVVNYTEKE